MIDLENIPIDITSHIRKFRDFLVTAWPHLDDIMEDHSWDDDVRFTIDWIQANWGLLVSRELTRDTSCILNIHIHRPTEHITKSLIKKPEYVVIVKSSQSLRDLKTGQIVPFQKKLRLVSFLRLKNGSLGIYPPFDVVELTSDSKQEFFYASFNELQFFLITYQNYSDPA